MRMYGRIALTAVIASVSLNGQLHLITGSPMPSSPLKFGSYLLEARPDGSVRSVAQLASENEGVAGVSVSYDLGIAFIQSYPSVVVDLKTATVRKACPSPPAPPKSGFTHEWLLATPSRGALFADSYFIPEQQRSVLIGTLLNLAVDCSKSHIPLDIADLQYVTANGGAVIADVGGSDADGLNWSADATGRIQGGLGGTVFSYEHVIPAQILAGLKGKRAAGGILINNSEIMVLGLSIDSGDRQLLAVRKKDKTWHVVPLPAARSRINRVPYPIVRAFGHHIAMAEVQPRTGPGQESAGRAGWRRGQSKTGPDTSYFFGAAEVVFPGRLHLYDVETERSYSITTDQADSEILLVDQRSVCYRVSDRIYAAPLSDSELGEPRLLATDELIRDVHWAFMKR